MGRSSNESDSSQSTTTTTVDNSSSVALQDVDGANIAGGDQTINVTDGGIAADAFDFGSDALDTVEASNQNALTFAGQGLKQLLDFGKTSVNAVGSAYKAASQSADEDATQQFQTTIRILGVGAVVVAGAYFVFRAVRG